LIVARVFLMILLAWPVLWGQSPPAQQPKPQHAEPEEEDVTLKPKEYTLNPVQAANELSIGRQYLKKGAYKGAAARFEEALKWNPQLADAYLFLGEAREKMGDRKRAKAAYDKYLELAPGAKNADEVSKRASKLANSKGSDR